MLFARRFISGVFVGIVGFFFSSPARAEATIDGTLAQPGKVVLDRVVGVGTSFRSGALGAVSDYQAGPVSFSHASLDLGGRVTMTSVALSPSFDVFVSRRVSLGGTFSIGAQSTSSENKTSGFGTSSGYQVSADPRVGVLFPITNEVAFWPKVGFGMGRNHVSIEGLSGSLESYRLSTRVDFDFALPLTKHVLVALGPYVQGSVYWGNDAMQLDRYRVAVGMRGGLSLAF